MADKRPIISDAQFSKLAGGSREVLTGKQGKGSGYYVSRDPRVPMEIGGGLEETKDSHDVAGIKEHLSKIKEVASKVVPTGWMRGRAATKKERSNIHQGIWQEGGKSYLDVSDRIGGRASTSSLREALQKGIEHNQWAIWAAGSKQALATHVTDKSGRKVPNPSAVKQVEYLKSQEEQSYRRSKMSKGQKAAEKNEALAAWEKAFPEKGK